MNPGHLAPVACLSFLLTPSSVFINLCLLLPLFLSTVFLHFSVPLLFFLGIHPFICLFTPALHLLKNYFAHLDGALLGRYAISPCAAVIKNRSVHQVRIRRDFSTSLISSCSPLHSHETVLARNGYTDWKWKVSNKMFQSYPFCFLPRVFVRKCVFVFVSISECLSVSLCTACGPLRWVLSHVELCVWEACRGKAPVNAWPEGVYWWKASSSS